MHICAWQSADSRVTTDHCRVTLRMSFYKVKFLIAWNVVKTLFDSRPTVAWPPTNGHVTVQRLFSKFSQIAWNRSKKRRLTVGRRSRDPNHFRVTVQVTFFKIFPKVEVKRPKNVVWQSADGRVTSDHCRVTVQRLFSNFFLIAWNV